MRRSCAKLSARRNRAAQRDRPSSHALVFGSLNVDMKTYMLSDIKANFSVATDTSPMSEPGGKGLNQAVTTARLGVTTHLVGLLGNDHYYHVLEDALTEVAKSSPLQSDGVVHAQQPGVKSGVAVVLVAKDNNKKTIFCPGANMCVDHSDAERAVELLKEPSKDGGSGRVDVVLLSLEVPIPPMRIVAAEAHARDCLVALKPSPVSKSTADAVRDLMCAQSYAL